MTYFHQVFLWAGIQNLKNICLLRKDKLWVYYMYCMYLWISANKDSANKMIAVILCHFTGCIIRSNNFLFTE